MSSDEPGVRDDRSANWTKVAISRPMQTSCTPFVLLVDGRELFTRDNRLTHITETVRRGERQSGVVPSVSHIETVKFGVLQDCNAHVLRELLQGGDHER